MLGWSGFTQLTWIMQYPSTYSFCIKIVRFTKPISDTRKWFNMYTLLRCSLNMMNLYSRSVFRKIFKPVASLYISHCRSPKVSIIAFRF